MVLNHCPTVWLQGRHTPALLLRSSFCGWRIKLKVMTIVFIKNPTEFWDGIGIVTLSGVLANFQLDNYFLPVKVIPLQLQLAKVFVYFLFSLWAHICWDCCWFQEATCNLLFQGCVFANVLNYLIFFGPHKFEIFLLYNHNLCSFQRIF